MSDISYVIISATSGSSGSELAFDTAVPDFVLLPGEIIKIGLRTNKSNVVWTVNETADPFDGTTIIEDYGYTTSSDASLVKVLTFTANPSFSGTVSFTITATSGDQEITSNEFTVSASGTPISKKLEILTNDSTLEGFDNSLGELEVVVQRGALLFSQPQGQEEFIEPGIYTFIVPDGVTQVSAVAIGGGGGAGIGGGAGGNLAYNTFTVVPGETLVVNVGDGGIGVGQRAKGQSSIPSSARPQNGGDSYIDSTSIGCPLYAPGGQAGSTLPGDPQLGDPWYKSINTTGTGGRPPQYAEAQANGQTLNLGGRGGNYTPFLYFDQRSSSTNPNFRNGNIEFTSAGGGAAGYAGTGGEGAPFTNTSSGLNGLDGRSPDINSGGAGGGGHSRYTLSYPYNGAGGGVGIYGLGADGIGGDHFVQFEDDNADPAQNGTGGSGGGIGSSNVKNTTQNIQGDGGLFGGGAAGASSYELTWNGINRHNQKGGSGAVRIIWGENRAYPSTNTQDVTPISQEDVDSTLGIANDTPVFKYTLNNPLATVSLPRLVTAKQFRRGQSTTSLSVFINDDPQGTEGTNIGTFELEITDVTDGYAIEGSPTVTLNILPNPNPPVKEIFIDETEVTKEVNEGEDIVVKISRISTRNGIASLAHSVNIDWQITTTVESKFTATTGSLSIGAGEEFVNLVISTNPDFAVAGEIVSGVLEIVSASSSVGSYNITTSTIDLQVNDVVKTVEIVNPVEETIEITEGQGISIELLSFYSINGIAQESTATQITFNFSNIDSRLILPENNSLGLAGTGFIEIDTSLELGLQSSVNTIFKIESADDGYVIKPPLSKIINVIDSANIVKQVFISTENIVAEEGDDLSITVNRFSTADDIDNYNDGGVTVPWRINGGDTRYSLTSGVIVFANGETEKTLTISTNDNAVGSLDIKSTFEIYEPTNNYVALGTANSIEITLQDNDPLYSITESTNFISEGGEVSFDISAIRVPDNTIVRAYINSETVTPSDFSGNVYTRDSVSYSGSYNTFNPEITTDTDPFYEPKASTKDDLLVIGDPNAIQSGLDYVGQVKIFRNISGTWTLEQTLTPPATDVQSSLLYGYSVAVDGDYIVVGALGWSYLPPNPALHEFSNGAVYFYKYNANLEEWELTDSLYETAEGSTFGYSVAIEDEYVVIGAPYWDTYGGKISVYKLDETTGDLNLFDTVTGVANNTFGPRIGSNVEIKNKRIVSGNRFASGSTISAGGWSLLAIGETDVTYVPRSGVQIILNGGDGFGWDVAINNNRVAVIHLDSSAYTDESRVYIYKFENSAWNWEQTLGFDETVIQIEFLNNYLYMSTIDTTTNAVTDKVFELQDIWTEISSIPTVYTGDAARQIVVNNITKEFFRQNRNDYKIYQPTFASLPITILDNSATFTLTTLVDSALESGEIFNLELWSDVAPNGTLLASSSEVLISESIYDIVIDKTEYNEGDIINVNISADVLNGATVPFTITGISETDVTSISGAGLVSGSWSGDTYTGTLQFSKSSPGPLQSVYTSSSTWVVPPGITEIKGVAVGSGGPSRGRNKNDNSDLVVTGFKNDDVIWSGGGGALAYVNSAEVTPGETLTITVNSTHSQVQREDGTVILKAEAGLGTEADQRGGRASQSIGDVAYSGGNGVKYEYNGATNVLVYSYANAGGGGAGGYNIAGGNAGQTNRLGTAGGLTSSSSGNARQTIVGGGGVGLLGGTATQVTTFGVGNWGGGSALAGDGTSNNTNTGVNTLQSANAAGGAYGGGAGFAWSDQFNVYRSNDPNSNGAVRILWGDDRTFPTNAGNATGSADTIATSSLTVELAEDLSVLEGEETLVLNINDTSVKNIPINDTSFKKEYYISNPANGIINKTEGDSGIVVETVTVSRTATEGVLEVPLTWFGSDSRFNNINKTVTFADGDTLASFTVSHTNNTTFDGDASGTYTLGEVASWTRGSPYVLTYNLTENESGTRTVTMQIPSDADYYTVANGENLLVTCTNMTLNGSSYKLYKINSNGSVTLLDILSVTHPNSVTRTLRRGNFSGGQYFGSYQTLSSWSGTRTLTRSLADHIVADNSYGSIGLFYTLDNGTEMLAVTAGVQISGLRTSSPSLLYRNGGSIYIASTQGRTYNRTVPVGFTAGISGINESAGRFGANWPNGGNGAMFFSSSTAFSVSSDGYQNNYYQDTPADRDGTDTGKNLISRQSTQFIWSPDAAVLQ